MRCGGVVLLAMLGGCDRRKGDDSGTPRSSDTPGTAFGEACADMALSWDLEVAWQSGHASLGVAVGRVLDTSGDGLVDNTDLPVLVSTVDEGNTTGIRVLTIGGSAPVEVVTGATGLGSRIGDVDGVSGAEVVAPWYPFQGDGGRVTLWGASGKRDIRLAEEAAVDPWITDLDRNGSAELLVFGQAIDAQTGSEVQWLRTNATDKAWPVAIDLDLDGQVEIVSGTPTPGGSMVGIVGASGEVEQPCVTTTTTARMVFAVGNLDDDDQGEFVTAGRNQIALCDTDATLIERIEVDLEVPSFAGIADLDGDGDAEILVTGDHWPEHPNFPLFVLDHRLRELWFTEYTAPAPFTVADLDGDGDHEILLLTATGLDILDGDGTVVAHWAMPADNEVLGLRAQPVVADVDADGLAEIVLPLKDTVVLDTPAGGFPAPGAVRGWSGRDHFPGIMGFDGSVQTAGGHWQLEGGNAWQGHGVCP